MGYTIFDMAYDGDDHIFSYGVHPHFLLAMIVVFHGLILKITLWTGHKFDLDVCMLDQWQWMSNGDLWMAEYYNHWSNGENN